MRRSRVALALAFIIIEDGKIVEVRDGFAPPPADARVVDLKNQFGRIGGGRV